MINQEEVMQFAGKGYTLGIWQVWPDDGTLVSDGHAVHVEPRVMAVLMCLIRAEGCLVSRDVLLESVWAGVVVNEEVVTRAVSELRSLLGDVGRQRRYVGTIPKKGYRLLMNAVPVETLMEMPAETPVEVSKHQGTQHAAINDAEILRRANLSVTAGFRLIWRIVHRSAAATGYLIMFALLLAFLF